jgi:hypothetical protein
MSTSRRMLDSISSVRGTLLVTAALVFPLFLGQPQRFVALCPAGFEVGTINAIRL